MNKIDLPPISINKCWQGRRFKTQEYKDWRLTMIYLLKGHKKFTERKPIYMLSVNIYRESLITYDSSNVIKGIEDALVDAEIIPDDRFIKTHFINKEKSENGENFFEYELTIIE